MSKIIPCKSRQKVEVGEVGSKCVYLEFTVTKLSLLSCRKRICQDSFACSLQPLTLQSITFDPTELVMVAQLCAPHAQGLAQLLD